MKLCVVCPTYPPNAVPCGIGDFTGELAERLDEGGVSTTVIASTRHRGTGGSAVRVVPLADRWDRRASVAIARIASRERFDVVNLQYTPELYGRGPWVKLVPALVSLGAGIPVVVTVHTLVGGYPSARLLAPLVLAPARRIIAPNLEVSGLIARNLPFLRRRVHEIPIGSNIGTVPGPVEAVRAALRAQLGAGADAVMLTHFGFAYPGKGIETLLAAAAHLTSAGVKYVLLMIGGAWPGAERYYVELEARSREEGLDAVRWLGHCPPERIAELLTATDIYVVPYDDGLSARRSTLIAGVMHHLPLVSTRPATPDPRFRDGEHALLVPPRDPEALAGALARLALSPDLRQRLRDGMAELAPAFSWATIVDATLATYREACR